MAIAYIYYKNNPKSVNVYFWEPQQKSIKHHLTRYKGSEDIFADKDMLIDFPEQKLYVKHNGQLFEAPLRDPKKDYANLKHQAHFDFDQGNWDDFIFTNKTGSRRIEL